MINCENNVSAIIYEATLMLNNRKLLPYVKKEEFFECGAFMGELFDKGFGSYFGNNQAYVIFKVARTSSCRLSEKIILWWLDIIKREFKIRVDYWGEEYGARYFQYYLPSETAASELLFKFTLFRYAWANPYNSLIERMYKVPEELIKKYGFWNIFIVLHNYLAHSDHYDSTFGLFARGTTSIPKDNKIDFVNILSDFFQEYGSMHGIQGATSTLITHDKELIPDRYRNNYPDNNELQTIIENIYHALH